MKKLINITSIILTLIFVQQAFGADINSVFSDVNTKTDSVLSWIMTSFLPFVCTIAAIACLVAIGLKKLSYMDGLALVIVIILIGFSPTIVLALLNR